MAVRMPLRVTHVINGLGQGGAERSLLRLLETMDRQDVQSSVISLSSDGFYADALRALDISLLEVDIKSFRAIADIVRIRKAMAGFRPDLVHGWMYHGAIFGKLLAPTKPSIASIRHSLSDPPSDSWSTKTAIALLRSIQRSVEYFVYASKLARHQHERAGFDPGKGVVIFNGVDHERFKLRVAEGAALRARLGVGAGDLVIASVGRFHAVKNQSAIVEAFLALAADFPKLHLLMAGTGIEPWNAVLWEPVVQSGLVDRVHLLGSRADIDILFSASDLVVSASRGEGFPNVLAEAMLCECPVVATDVGETAAILGNIGRSLPSPVRLAAFVKAIRYFLKMTRDERCGLGKAGRSHIMQNFPPELEAIKFHELYRSIAERHHS